MFQKKNNIKCICVLLGGIHEVIVKKLVNYTWQHLKLEAPVGIKARDCRPYICPFYMWLKSTY